MFLDIFGSCMKYLYAVWYDVMLALEENFLYLCIHNLTISFIHVPEISCSRVMFIFVMV